MALYHKWDVKNGFAYVLQFFSLISDSLGFCVQYVLIIGIIIGITGPSINDVGNWKGGGVKNWSKSLTEY